MAAERTLEVGWRRQLLCCWVASRQVNARHVLEMRTYSRQLMGDGLGRLGGWKGFRVLCFFLLLFSLVEAVSATHGLIFLKSNKVTIPSCLFNRAPIQSWKH
ncbi:unnamed protein product, partial [Ectocarpus fasciculatus]